MFSGYLLRVATARTGVSKIRYEPEVPGGEPTRIDLRIEVSFKFS